MSNPKVISLLLTTATLLGQLLIANAACSTSKHGIETVYGGYEYRYEVTEFLFAVDDSHSFDLVGAGSTESAQRFIYLLRGSECPQL